MLLAGLIESPGCDEFLGMVSDRGLLSWFSSYAAKTPSFQKFLTNSLRSFDLPSLNLYDAVIASTANSTVLDAMKLMSEEGVSSIAVLDDESGNLLSAVSVTDIGKVCRNRPRYVIRMLTGLNSSSLYHVKVSMFYRRLCTNLSLSSR
jgi:CBS-domain-containing membrane protein